jgi:hypothetical protein
LASRTMKQFGVTSAVHGGGKRREGIYALPLFVDHRENSPARCGK